MQRLETLFDEIAELTGQRNAIDARIVEIVAEMLRDELCGATGARSIQAVVAWKTGIAPRNAETVVAVARRLEEFPRCAQGMREGRLSLDQVGVIAEKAADGSDEHYAELAAVATVRQLRTAVKLEPRPAPETRPEPERSITKNVEDEYTTWRIRLPRLDAAKFDTALQSHHDAVIADWKRDHDTDGEPASDQAPPFPNLVDVFMSLVEAGWTSRRYAARTGSTLLWPYMSTWTKTVTNQSPQCIWGRCSPRTNDATYCAMPPVRPGSNAAAR
ncbi:hypothetical protein J2S38_004449 [Mycolicibacterium senegalense]|nr:hypothetical protein [Mycolicibacterium senegalense]